MGFSEYFIQSLSSPTETPATTTKVAKLPDDDHRRLPDQEILDGTEEIYFKENVNCGEYELNVIILKWDFESVFINSSIRTEIQ